jgi:sugar phosphate isomerase/epimerase
MPEVGCQTYTWEMRGAEWRGTVDEMLDAIADAGYSGVEITNSMIREYAERPNDFAAALKARGLKLAAYAFASPAGFTDPASRTEELAGADRALAFTAHFPGVPLCIGGAHSTDRRELDRKIGLAADFYNEVGRRGRRINVDVAFHPHSHHGSILESRDEYDRVMTLTDPDIVKWNPDTGHIVRGGQNLLDTLRAYGARIRHVHLKDANAAKEWVALGKGVCDIPSVLDLLEKAIGYSGWIVGEEESKDAWSDPTGAIRWNRQFLKGLGY